MRKRLRESSCRQLAAISVIALGLGGAPNSSEAQPSPAARDGRTIGLALSGAGFRAAGCHLRVLEELERRGLLDDVAVVSCVSGGCIAAGVVLFHWNDPNRLQILESRLTTSKWVAAGTVLSAILHPFKSRLEELEDSYHDDLFEGDVLGSFASSPRVYFNSTNIATGNRFFFSAGRAPAIPGSPTDVVMKDHETPEVPAGDVPIATALAASSAFPPVFNPLRVEAEPLREAGLEHVTLSDGGVYDNMGLNLFLYDVNFWPEHLDYVSVSDGAKPFALDEKPATSALVAHRIDEYAPQLAR